MQPHFRRHYELISFALNSAVPILLSVVVFTQDIQIKKNVQELENLRADIATIRLNQRP